MGIEFRAGLRVSGVAILMSVPLLASSLRLSGETSTEGYPAGSVSVFKENPAAVFGDTLNASQLSGPDVNHTAFFSGEVNFGRLSSRSRVSGTDIPGTPGAYYIAGVGVVFDDSITIHGATSGYLSLDLSVHGEMSKGSGSDDSTLANFTVTTRNSAGLQTNTAGIGMRWLGTNPPSVFPGTTDLLTNLRNAITISGSTDGFIFQGQGTVLIPFSEALFDLVFGLSTSAACHMACTAISDFSNTALIGGVKILDASMVEIPGAFLTSQSGFDYKTLGSPGSPGADVPEPASVTLLAGALAFLCWRQRRGRPNQA